MRNLQFVEAKARIAAFLAKVKSGGTSSDMRRNKGMLRLASTRPVKAALRTNSGA